MTNTDGNTAASAEAKAAYVAALQAQDWQSDFSDDMRAFRRGRESIAALRVTQQAIDGDFQIWNSVAPEQFQIHVIPGIEGSAS